MALLSDTMWKFTNCAPADHKGQGSFFSSGVDGCRLTVEGERQKRLLGRLPPAPCPENSNNLERNPLKRMLKNGMRKLSLQLMEVGVAPQLMEVCVAGEGLTFL